jgi:hypothetical protein
MLNIRIAQEAIASLKSEYRLYVFNAMLDSYTDTEVEALISNMIHYHILDADMILSIYNKQKTLSATLKYSIIEYALIENYVQDKIASLIDALDAATTLFPFNAAYLLRLNDINIINKYTLSIVITKNALWQALQSLSKAGIDYILSKLTNDKLTELMRDFIIYENVPVENLNYLIVKLAERNADYYITQEYLTHIVKLDRPDVLNVLIDLVIIHNDDLQILNYISISNWQIATILINKGVTINYTGVIEGKVV